MAAGDTAQGAEGDGLDGLDPSALAWEMLRRNPAYREAFASGADLSDFGLQFALDPDLPASRVDPLWRPELAPAVAVRFTPVVVSAATARRLQQACVFSRSNEAGLHLRFPGGLQACLPSSIDLDQPVGAVLPLGRDLAVRILLARAMQRGLFGRWSALPRLSRARRLRLVRALRAHDLRLAGAAYREIAARLLGADFQRSMDWRTSSARATAIRLCASGRELVSGGYLALLGGRPTGRVAGQG